jgi:hypothetical protein
MRYAHLLAQLQNDLVSTKVAQAEVRKLPEGDPWRPNRGRIPLQACASNSSMPASTAPLHGVF